jgi:hypothetical protein
MAAVTAKVYPAARRSFIKQGRPAAEVDAMTATQVVWIYTVQQYDRVADDLYKWDYLPLSASAGKTNTVEIARRAAHDNPFLVCLVDLIPSLNSARVAGLRLDRYLDVLQCIEALRLYAAAHNGEFPSTLDALTDAPAPNDPSTGKPFEYKRGDRSATLNGPMLPGAAHRSYLIRYELKATP